jgi:hypothetical protein
LKDNLIQIYHLPTSVQIREAVRLLTQNLLERMVSPLRSTKKIELNG